MTSDRVPNEPHQLQDELLTAYALGEAGAEERAAVERLLAGDDGPAVEQQLHELRTLASALKHGLASEPPLARSPRLRRAVVAASATAAPEQAPPRRRRRPANGWLLLGAGGLAAALLVATWPLLEQRANHRDIAMRKPVDMEHVAIRRIVDEASPLAASPAASSGPSPVRLGEAPAPTEEVAPASSPLIRAVPPAVATADARLSLEAASQPALVLEAAAPSSNARPRRPMASLDAKAGGPGPYHGARPEIRGGSSASRELLERVWQQSREQYGRFPDSRFLSVDSQPLSTFSIDVDTASYANLRRFLMAGRRPPRDAVRIEELVNYFRYADPAPTGDDPFSVTVEATTCPWRSGHRLVRIGLKGRDVARDARPAGNLVFLIDVSGSMADADKLPLVKQALLMLVDELTEDDRVSIVTYAGEAGLKLPATSGDQKERIRVAIESLASGGSTHGSAGIELAYEQAAAGFVDGGANRVILATDGDLNVGITDDASLVDLITRKAKGGTFLTVLGFGQGNLQDEKMEKLADKGNGVYAYIDGAREARKVLVEQLTGSTITIAKDVKIQVEFNPAVVATYRLLGYENRALADADFRDDSKDAGEIGAGHGVTALYELELVGDGAKAAGRGAEPLKYQPQPAAAEPVAAGPEPSGELLTVKLRYKLPDGDASRLIEMPLADKGGEFSAASTDLRFTAAVAAFGMILRQSPEAGEASLPLVASIATGALGADPGGYRAEFLDLVRRAESAQ